MAGIIDIGVYIPRKRITHDIYFKATGNPLSGERAVADFDEDSITLSYSAASNILSEEQNEEIDALFFVSSTPVLNERSNAGIVATALDLKKNIIVSDIQGSAGVLLSSINHASFLSNHEGTRTLIVAGEKKRSRPASFEESSSGDAGSAVLIGDHPECLAIIEDYLSSYSSLSISWQRRDMPFPASGELKFNMEKLFKEQVISGIKNFLKNSNMDIKDISSLLVLAPDGRSHTDIYKTTGIKEGRDEVEEVYRNCGYCGTATPLILLASFLKTPREGKRILLCSAGDGVELLLLKTTGKKYEGSAKIQNEFSHKMPLTDYTEFLKIRDILDTEKINPFSSMPVLFREEDSILRFRGKRCKKCKSIQYPPRRICWQCSAKDEMEDVKLKKEGTIYTFTRDYVYTSPFPPTAMAVVDLDGGGRFYGQVVDSDKNRIKIKSRVKLTLRKLHEGEELVHYFWKITLRDNAI